MMEPISSPIIHISERLRAPIHLLLFNSMSAPEALPVEDPYVRTVGGMSALLARVPDLAARAAAVEGAVDVVVATDRASSELAAAAIVRAAEERRERERADNRAKNPGGPGGLGGLVRYAEAEDIDLAEKLFYSVNGVEGDYGRLFGENGPRKRREDWRYGHLIVEHCGATRRRLFRFSGSCSIAVLRVERLCVLLAAAAAAEEARLAAYRAAAEAVARERAERDARREAEPIAGLLARIKSEYLYKMTASRNCDYFPLVDGEFVFGQGVLHKGAVSYGDDAAAREARATEADVEAIAAMHERAVEIGAPERAEREVYVAVMNARNAGLDPSPEPMATQDIPRLVVIHRAGVHWLTVDRCVGDERAVVYDVDCVRKAARRCVDINYPLSNYGPGSRSERLHESKTRMRAPLSELATRVPRDMIATVMHDAVEILPLMDGDIFSNDINSLRSSKNSYWLIDRDPWDAAMNADAAEAMCMHRDLRSGNKNNAVMHRIPRVVIIHKCGFHIDSCASRMGSHEAEVYDIDVLWRLMSAAARE